MRKKVLSFIVLSLFFVPLLAATTLEVQATSGDKDYFGTDFVDGNNLGNDKIVLSAKDPRTIASKIINTILTLLGIVAVVIVLLGGFKWMTSGGNEEKVGEAKKLLGAGVIGLVIILAAWGITKFALQELMKATGND